MAIRPVRAHLDVPLQVIHQPDAQLRLARAMSQKEQLDNLNVQYNRDPQCFWHRLSEPEKQKSINELSSDYRTIILNYFPKRSGLNRKVDEFVCKAFSLDLSVSQIIEIHMELMDAFAKQLKLEGRNEEVLLDYRLTLIDIIAHLCEMYRRSIPKEP